MPPPPKKPRAAASKRAPLKTSPRQAAKAVREDALASSQLARQQDLRVAATFKAAVEEVLVQVKFGKPLEADAAPRPGPEGQLVAPNGDPLLRLKLCDGVETGSSQYALVNPKTNQFYKEDNLGHPLRLTNLYGPLSLPRGSQLKEKKPTRDELRQLERAANAAHKTSLPKSALLVVLAKLLRQGPAAFAGQAIRKADTLSETVFKKEHPFTYTALVRKDDPSRVVIKRVMTGGFLPAGPGEGDYSQPFSLK